MAKSKVKKPHPKPPAEAKTVVAIKKKIDDRKAKLAKRIEAAKKDGGKVSPATIRKSARL